MIGNSIIKKMAVAAVVAVGAIAVPAVASASTTVPPLQTGDTQAFASLTAGGPHITSPITRTFRTASGAVLTLNAAGGFQVRCTSVFTVTINTNGTTSVTAATFSGCTTNVAGCNAVVTATSGTPGLPWGDRLVQNSGVFRDRINVANLVNTLSGTCPVPAGSYPFGGIISPITTGGNPATITFDNPGSGPLSNPSLGTATVTGSLQGTSGEPTFFVL